MSMRCILISPSMWLTYNFANCRSKRADRHYLGSGSPTRARLRKLQHHVSDDALRSLPEDGELPQPIPLGRVVSRAEGAPRLWIVSLGHAEPLSSHSPPVGFCSLRLWWAVQMPEGARSGKMAWYRNLVLENEGHKLYLVKMEGVSPPRFWQGLCMGKPWSSILQLVNATCAGPKKRPHGTISGPEMFGWCNVLVRQVVYHRWEVRTSTQLSRARGIVNLISRNGLMWMRVV